MVMFFFSFFVFVFFGLLAFVACWCSSCFFSFSFFHRHNHFYQVYVYIHTHTLSLSTLHISFWLSRYNKLSYYKILMDEKQMLKRCKDNNNNTQKENQKKEYLQLIRLLYFPNVFQFNEYMYAFMYCDLKKIHWISIRFFLVIHTQIYRYKCKMYLVLLFSTLLFYLTWTFNWWLINDLWCF